MNWAATSPFFSSSPPRFSCQAGRQVPVQVGERPVDAHARRFGACKEEGRIGLIAPPLQAPHQPRLGVERKAMLQLNVGPVAAAVAVQGHIGEAGRAGRPPLYVGFVVAVDADQPLFLVVEGAPPGQVNGAGFDSGGALPVVVVDRIGVAHAAFKAVVAGAQGEFVPGVEAIVAAQAEGLADAGVIQAPEAVVADPRCRQAQAQVVTAAGPAGADVGDAAIAGVDLTGGATLLMAVPGDDVDHAQEGIGAVSI
jgi:hypothetical protein